MQILVRSTTILLEKCYFGVPFILEERIFKENLKMSN